MVNGPGLYSDIGKRARDLYQSDHKFTLTTYTSTGVAIISSGTKKGELFLADVNTQLKNKNIATDLKVDTMSNYFTQYVEMGNHGVEIAKLNLSKGVQEKQEILKECRGSGINGQ